jgi:hypothetical protein
VRGFVYRLIPPRPDFAFTMNEAERTSMDAHARYWATLLQQHKAVAYGPVNDPAGPYGIAIVTVEHPAEAEAIRDGDPAVQSPHGFRSELTPMLSLVTPQGRFDAV